MESMSLEPTVNNDLQILIYGLMDRLGRIPTEDEVIEFVNGNEDVRLRIWNQEEKINGAG